MRSRTPHSSCVTVWRLQLTGLVLVFSTCSTATGEVSVTSMAVQPTPVPTSSGNGDVAKTASPFESPTRHLGNIRHTQSPPTDNFPSYSIPSHQATTRTPTLVLVTPMPLPSHYLILRLGVAANQFNHTLFLTELRTYLSFNPSDVVFQPDPQSEMEIAIYIRNDTATTTELIDNFVAIWHNVPVRATVFKETTKGLVVGYHVVPMANLSLPTIQSRLCEGFRLRLQVPIDQFNHTLFLMRFSKYVKFNPQNIVIEPASGSGMEIRIYVQDSPTKTCEFIHNLVAVWDDTNLRNTVFGSAITQQVAGYVTGAVGETDDLPGWAVALIIVISIITVTATVIFSLFYHRWSHRSKSRKRRFGIGSFRMGSLYQSQANNEESDRKHVTKPNRSQFPVQSRPLTLQGLTKALEDEEKLVDEFQRIPLMMSSAKDIPRGSKKKNRYATVLPSQNTRVPLFLRFDDPNSDYINANFVRGYSNKPKVYIAAQAPLESTVTDFWRMIWEQRVEVVLMATHLVEGDTGKCARYWPDKEDCGTTLVLDNLEVSVISQEHNDFSIISRYCLKQREPEISREVVHHWFTAWPFYGVPDDPSDLIGYLEAAQFDTVASNGPIVVHCSNGIGRTGVIIAIHIGMQQLEESCSCDVLETVWKLRQDRGGLVQTKAQYIFTYTALEVYASHLEIVRDEQSRKLQSTPAAVHEAIPPTLSPYDEV